MEFLKKFFNDDSTVIGLCKFNNRKPNVITNSDDYNFVTNRRNETEMAFSFETDFSRNLLLL